MNQKSKRNLKYLLGGSIVVFGTVLALKKSASDKLQYNIKIHKISFKDFRLNIELLFEIANPSNQNLRVNSISGDIYFNQTNLGLFRQLQAFEIAPKMVTKVLITVLPNTANAVKSIPLIIATKSPKLTVKYTINSIITINDSMELPISF